MRPLAPSPVNVVLPNGDKIEASGSIAEASLACQRDKT